MVIFVAALLQDGQLEGREKGRETKSGSKSKVVRDCEKRAITWPERINQFAKIRQLARVLFEQR